MKTEESKSRLKSKYRPFRHAPQVRNRKLRCGCSSFACQSCAKEHQNNFARGVHRFMDLEKKATGKWSFVTFIPHLNRPTNESFYDYIRRVKAFIETRLRMARVNTFIGALDFSYNVDGRESEKEFEPHWSIHVHGFTPERQLTPLVKRRLHKSFRSSSAVPRPVNIKVFDGSDDAIAYVMKPNFKLRTTLQMSSSQPGKPRSFRNSISGPLPAKQNAELQQALQSLTLNDRMILLGVDVIGDPSTGPLRLRSIASTLAQARTTPVRQRRLPLSKRLASRKERILSPTSSRNGNIETALIKLREAVNDRELFPLIPRGKRLSPEQAEKALGFRRDDKAGAFIAIRASVMARIVGDAMVDEVVKQLERKKVLIVDGDRNTRRMTAAGFLGNKRHRCYCLREAALKNIF